MGWEDVVASSLPLVRSLERLVEPGMSQATDGRDGEHVTDPERHFVTDELAAEDLLGDLGGWLDLTGVEDEFTQLERRFVQSAGGRGNERVIDLEAERFDPFAGVQRHEECRVGIHRVADLDELGRFDAGLFLEFAGRCTEVRFAGIEEAARYIPDAATLVGTILLDHADEQIAADDGVGHDHRAAAAVLLEVPGIIAADVAIFEVAKARIAEAEMGHIFHDSTIDFHLPATLGLIYDIIFCHVKVLF